MPIDDDFDSDLEELPKSIRISMAHEAWKAANRSLSIRKAARQHGIAYHTLIDRIHGAILRQEANKAMQKLSPAEELCLIEWSKDLHGWGWPAHVEQLYRMVQELLISKGDTQILGVNWVSCFLDRHPELGSRYVPLLDKERALAQNPDTI